MNRAQIVKIRPECAEITLPRGERIRATMIARGSAKHVPTTEPDAILRIAMCGTPSLLAREQFRTMGTAIVLPGRAVIAVGIVCAICIAVIIPTSQANRTTAGAPASTRMIVIGTIVAVSSVPGMIPMIVYKRPPPTAAKIASRIVMPSYPLSVRVFLCIPACSSENPPGSGPEASRSRDLPSP